MAGPFKMKGWSPFTQKVGATKTGGTKTEETEKKIVEDPYTPHNVGDLGGDYEGNVNVAKSLNMNLRRYNARPGQTIKTKEGKTYTFPTV
jgi:hypothetical protein